MKNQIEILEDRALVHLSGRHGKGRAAQCSLRDVELVSKIRWSLSRSMRDGKMREGYASGYDPRIGKRILMHRFILGSTSGKIIDHINHDNLDNRRENLRYVENDFNVFHTPKWGDEVGVSFDKSRNKWEAYISKSDKKIHLGRFSSKEEAIAARKQGEMDRFSVLKPRSK